MMRRRLGSLLIATGLAVMAWPIVTWAYGLYWQERLVRSFPRTADLAVPVDAQPAPPRGASPFPQPAKPPKPVSKPAKPRRPALRDGQAFARLSIDRIGLNAVVVEGTSGKALRRGPGHLPKSGLPGENRNCAIAAHRDGWFLRLHRVRAGDSVWMETPDGLYEYVVEQKRVVTPDRGDLLNQGRKPVLTLITCTGPGYPHSAYRLLVFCRLRDAYPPGTAQVGSSALTHDAAGFLQTLQDLL